MAKNIYFHATRNDLLPILHLVESRTNIKYTRADVISAKQADTFFRGEEIPNLGIASSESAINCDTFLVSERNTEILPRKLSPIGGNVRFAFDQLHNPQTVTFSAGGWWGNDVLLEGRIATASDHPTSLELMKLFASAVRKNFSKIKAYYVGSEAESHLRQGKRLAQAAQSPREFDLSLD
jgi:hypothetical protein